MGIPGSTWQMFQRNAQTALLFEVVYKVILFSIVIPVETALLDLAMAAGGFSYLDTTNLLAFIASPVTWAILIVMVLFLAFYSLVEISALIALMHASRNAQTLRVRDTFALGAFVRPAWSSGETLEPSSSCCCSFPSPLWLPPRTP